MNLTRLSAALLLGAALTTACETKPADTTATAGADNTAVTLLKPGPWRGELAAQGQQIPFLFEVKEEAGKPVVYLINKGLDGEERLRCPEIIQAGDSVTVKLHIFDAAFVLRADGADKLKGVWVKYDAKEPYRVPLVAIADAEQLFDSEGTKVSVLNTKLLIANGQKFSTEFTDEAGKKYPAVSILKQQQGLNNLTGTFLTTTGDYRYLSGGIHIRQGEPHIMLSTFDGNHAFLFVGRMISPSKESLVSRETGKIEEIPIRISGHFYSGKSGHETFTAVFDPNAKLPDANALTA
jgi:hypothetical protein